MKYKFRVKMGVLLGHVINKKAIQAHPDLMKAVKALSKLKSRKDV